MYSPIGQNEKVEKKYKVKKKQDVDADEKLFSKERWLEVIIKGQLLWLYRRKLFYDRWTQVLYLIFRTLKNGPDIKEHEDVYYGLHANEK